MLWTNYLKRQRKNELLTVKSTSYTRLERKVLCIKQGRSDGGYIGIYTPKISPSKLFMG